MRVTFLSMIRGKIFPAEEITISNGEKLQCMAEEMVNKSSMVRRSPTELKVLKTATVFNNPKEQHSH